MVLPGTKASFWKVLGLLSRLLLFMSKIRECKAEIEDGMYFVKTDFSENSGPHMIGSSPLGVDERLEIEFWGNDATNFRS